MPDFPKKIQIALLVILITTAVFFRFYKVRPYIVFLGDEGRDAIVMREIFTKHHVPFLGPTASVGGFYLGPIYYWMAAPFLFLWNYDPVGPAYFVAAIGVLTVFLLFKFAKENFGFYPAILVSFLYATAPLVVRYSRSSWNPNPLPFFALLLIYCLYVGIKKGKNIYFVAAGACFGIAIQLHYLAAILIIVAAFIVFINANYKKWVHIILLSSAGFLITFSPFLIFEIRHNYPNFKTILEFVTRGSTVGYHTFNPLWQVSDSGNIFLEYISNLQRTVITRLTFWVLSFGMLIGLAKYWKQPEKKLIFSIAFIWFAIGLFSIRLYTGEIYDYYYGSIFPAPFLAFAALISLVWHKTAAKFIVFLLVAGVIIYFVMHSVFTTAPNSQIEQTKNIVSVVIEKTNSKPFNFALMSEHNSDHAYRYFLDVENHPATNLEDNITDQLLVVCEEKKCSPLGYSLWEVAAFGRAEIKGEWDIEKYGIKIFKLEHWPGAPNPAGKPAKKLG